MTLPTLRGETTLTGWRLPNNMTVEEWKAAGQTLGRIERAVMWWIGDWWAYGEHRYGDRKAIVEAPDWSGPKFQTCANAANVCRAFETSRRREVLTFTHHAEVAALPQLEADKLLTAAEPKTGDKFPRLSVSELRGEIKRVRRLERIAELTDPAWALADLHGKVYNVIYADPPWRFEPYSQQTGMDRAADNHYPTMRFEDIRDLAVPGAAECCALFLWTTAPMEHRVHCVILDAWGFEYKTQFVWVKDRIGTGYWNRNQHEILLVATRGDIPAPTPGTQWSSVIHAPVGEHSAKPEIFAEMIEAYFPIVSKLEMFRRGPARPGWDAWGNETPPSMDKEERPF